MLPTLRESIFAYNRIWQQLYADELIELPDYQITITPGQPDTFYNAAHFAGPASPKNMGDIEAVFGARNLRAGLYLPEGIMPPAGYEIVAENEEVWWIKPLDADVLNPALSEGLTIQRVDLDELDDFLKVDAVANDLDDGLVALLARLIRQRRSYENRLFIGLHAGMPVACGSVGFMGGIACLAEGGVLPEFRGRGFHRSMTCHRLAEAVQAGARYALMVSAAGSRSNTTAQSVGFERLMTRKFYRKI